MAYSMRSFFSKNRMGNRSQIERWRTRATNRPAEFVAGMRTKSRVEPLAVVESVAQYAVSTIWD